MRCLHSCWGAASRWAYRRLGDAAVWTFFSFVVGKPQRPLNEVPAPAEPDYEEDGAWCCLPGTQGTAASLYPADDDDAVRADGAHHSLGLRVRRKAAPLLLHALVRRAAPPLFA